MILIYSSYSAIILNNSENSFYVKGNKYYVITGVYRSPSISIISEDKNGQKINVDTQTILSEHPGAKIGIDNSKSAEGEVRFTGEKSLHLESNYTSYFMILRIN